MAQRLKDVVQESIARGALHVFARRGFAKATMAEIARAAGVSTGNIYHYYPNKNDLFEAVVSDQFVRRFNRLLRRRIRALDGIADISRLGHDSPYAIASETLLAFAVEDRLRIVVLLGRSEGTRYENFAERLVQDLLRLALAHARTVRAGLDVTPALRFTLDQVYRNWLRTVVGILERFETGAEIREATEMFTAYHLTGLKSVLT